MSSPAWPRSPNAAGFAHWPPCCLSHKLVEYPSGAALTVPAATTVTVGLNGSIGTGLGWDVHQLFAWDTPVPALANTTGAGAPMLMGYLRVLTGNLSVELAITDGDSAGNTAATFFRYVSPQQTQSFAHQVHGRFAKVSIRNSNAAPVTVTFVLYARRCDHALPSFLDDVARQYHYDNGAGYAMAAGENLISPIFYAGTYPFHLTAPLLTPAGIIHHVGTSNVEAFVALPNASANSKLVLEGADKSDFSDKQNLLSLPNIAAGGYFTLQEMVSRSLGFTIDHYRVPSAYWRWILHNGDTAQADARLMATAGGIS